MAAGMSLGAAPGSDLAALERSHREALAEEDRVVLVAERNGEVVAMAHLAPSRAANAPHRAEVQRVAVAGAARGSGVGRILMAAVEEEAQGRGLTLLWLTTHDGTPATTFYESVGYTRMGVMPGYSLRPDGSVSPAAFFYRDLSRREVRPPETERAESAPVPPQPSR
jgi:ribosomal protein S18 acetylase RimI-like enzyme